MEVQLLSANASTIHGRTQIFNTTEDLSWLFEVHLPDRPIGDALSAIIVGNEDCPDEIWLSELAEPLITTPFLLAKSIKPLSEIVRDRLESGVAQVAFGPKWGIRRYEETHYSRDVTVDGVKTGSIAEYHSVWKKILTQPRLEILQTYPHHALASIIEA